MDKNIVKKEITSLIESLNHQSVKLKENTISGNDMDLFLEVSRKLHEKCVLLKYLNGTVEEAGKKENVITIAPGQTIDPSERIITAASAEPERKPSIPEPQIIVEEKTSQKVHSHHNINKIPLTDIKAGIGINEKIRFIKELFKGNSDEYNSTINLLNGSGDINTAKENLGRLQKKHNWDPESEVVISFLELVERRFI